MNARAWADTLAVGRRGETILDAVFGVEYILVKATRHHERQGVDRFFVHRRDGRVIYRVDYKTDEVAGRTGNLALEHVSVVRKGRREAKGWIHTTIAELVISYVPALDTAFILEVETLRLAWPDIMRLYPPKFASTSSDNSYQSLNCCVPITWLRESALISRTVEVVNAQLRLPLTMRRPG